MNIDLLTRQEACKIERVLSDLVSDLEVVSLVPDDFALWLRDDLVSLVDKEEVDAAAVSLLQNYGAVGGGGEGKDSKGKQAHARLASARHTLGDASRARAVNLASLTRADKVSLLHSENSSATAAVDKKSSVTGVIDAKSPKEVYMQHLARARGFVGVASNYGDPADAMNNTAVVQVNDFSYLERALIDVVTTTGHIDAEDVYAHRLAVRGLVDMLRENRYVPLVKQQLAILYPLSSSSSSSKEAEFAGGSPNEGNTRNVEDDEGEEECDESSESTKMHESRWFSDFLTNPTAVTSSSACDSPENVTSHSRTDSCKSAIGQASSDATTTTAALDTAEACARGALSEGLVGFTHVIRVLAQLVHRRNRFTVHDDQRRYQILHEAVHKEQSASADVQSLNREYEQVCATRRRRVAELDDEIAQLNEEMLKLQQSADDELQQFRRTCAEQRDEQRVTYAQRLHQHRVQSDRVMQSLSKLQSSNAEETNQKRSLRAKKEAAVSGAIAEYDSQMHTTRHILKKLRDETDEDTTRMVALEAQLTEMRAAKAEYELEQHDAQQKEEHTDVIQQHLQHNARVVQAYFRAYLAQLTVAEDMKKATRRPKRKVKSTK